jgi:hypothetical protein
MTENPRAITAAASGGGFANCSGQDGEVDLEAVAKEDTALREAAGGCGLEERQQRCAERPDPRDVAQVTLGDIDEEGQVDVGKLIRRRIDPRLRADEEDGPNVVSCSGPGSHRIEEPANASNHAREATSEEMAVIGIGPVTPACEAEQHRATRH